MMCSSNYSDHELFLLFLMKLSHTHSILSVKKRARHVRRRLSLR